MKLKTDQEAVTKMKQYDRDHMAFQRSQESGQQKSVRTQKELEAVHSRRRQESDEQKSGRRQKDAEAADSRRS